MLVAGAIALAGAQNVQADPLPTLPSLPPVPQLPAPSLPQVPVPSVPRVPVPSLPQAPTPTLPRVPVGSRAPALRLPNNPAATTAPARTGATKAAPRRLTRPRTAAGGIAAGGGGSASAPSGGARRPDDARPGGTAREQRARRISREPSSKRLRRLLKPLAACVATLGPLQERVIVRRAGLRGFKAQTRRELAKTLGTSRRRVARLERRGLRNLRRAIRAGGCGAPSAATPGVPGTSGTLVAERLSAPAQGSGGSRTERQAVKGVSESKSGSAIDSAAGAGRDALAAISEPARSFAEQQPLAFALFVLGTLLCGVLLVRELRQPV